MQEPIDQRIADLFAARRVVAERTSQLEETLPEGLSRDEAFLFPIIGIGDETGYVLSVAQLRKLDQQLRGLAGREVGLVTRMGARFTPYSRHIHPIPGEEPSPEPFTDYHIALARLDTNPLERGISYHREDIMFPTRNTAVLRTQINDWEAQPFLSVDPQRINYQDTPLVLHYSKIPTLFTEPKKREILGEIELSRETRRQGQTDALWADFQVLHGRELEAFKQRILEEGTGEGFDWASVYAQRDRETLRIK